MASAAWGLQVLFAAFVIRASSIREHGQVSPLDMGGPISLMAKLNAAASDEKSFEVGEVGGVQQTFTLAKDGYRGAGAFALVFQVSRPAEPETALVAKFLKMDPGPEDWPNILRKVLSDESTKEAGQELGVEVDWDLVHLAQRSLTRLISIGTVATFGGTIPVQIGEDAGHKTLRVFLQSIEKMDAAEECAIASKLLAVLYLLTLHRVEHGDIKSDNVMFDGQILKVIDFDSMIWADSPSDLRATAKVLKELHGKSQKSEQTNKGYNLALRLIKAEVATKVSSSFHRSKERLAKLAEASHAYGC